MPTRRRGERSKQGAARPAAGGAGGARSSAAPGGSRSASRPSGDRTATPPYLAWLLIPIALFILLWSSRGALLGVAVADDYSFLDALRFQSPLNWLGSMQAAFYWRPLSRQAYFSAIGPFLLAAPWLAAAVNLTLIVGTSLLLYRIARHVTSSAWVAAAVAAGVLLSEPVRVLLAWPSGIQHLLGGFAAALAVHEALEGRFLTAGVSTLAAMLSQESGVLAAVVVPLAAWRAHGRAGHVRAGLAVAVAVAVWVVGYWSRERTAS
jgi:hypothetical protein